jgi:hypothetical protein
MQGLYNIDENVKTGTDTSTWIPVGIHENLELVDVVYGTTKNNKEFLAFYAENEQGDKVSNTEWPANFSKPIEQMTDQEKEAALAVLENQKAKVKQIVEIYKPNFNITASTFKEFAEKTIEFLGVSYKGVKIRLKVVFDRRGYTTFAQKGRYPFIEPMTISKEDSKIRILQSDKMIRDSVNKDKENNEFNPLELDSQKNSTTEEVDNLPF